MTHSETLALRARIRSARLRHPGWHIFASSTGHIYAVSRNAADPAGLMQTTVDARSAALIGRAIRAREAEMGRMALPAEWRAA